MTVWHTCHGTNIMLAEALCIVNEVLPLIPDRVAALSWDWVVVTLCLSIEVIRSAIVLVVGEWETVAEAGSVCDILNWCEVKVCCTIYVHTVICSLWAVTLWEWVSTRKTLIEVWCRIVTVCVTKESVTWVACHCLVIVRSIFAEHLRAVCPIERSERVDEKKHLEWRAIAVLRDTAWLPPLDRVVCTNFQPVLNLIVCINLGAETCVLILVALYDTVLVNIAATYEVWTTVIGTLEGDGMLLWPWVLEICVHPVCICIRIPVVLILILVHICINLVGSELHAHPVFELRSVEKLTDMTKSLICEFGGVIDAALTLFARFCCNENNTVTSLSTIDSSWCRILKNLYWLNHWRIEILDAWYLKTINDEQWTNITWVRWVTADTNGSSWTWFTRWVQNLHTRCLTLKRWSGICRRKTLDIIALYWCNRTG